jgi:membrane protein required for colicin V production
MNGADHLFGIILLVSGFLGFLRGFVREAISLLAWLVGLWFAWHFAYLVYPMLGGALAQPGVREWTARAVVLFLVLLAGAGVGALANYFTRRASGLAIMDRTLGTIFGLMRGVVVVGLLVIGGRVVHLDLEPWWGRTKSMPVAEAVANWLEGYARPAAEELLDRANEEPGG